MKKLLCLLLSTSLTFSYAAIPSNIDLGRIIGTKVEAITLDSLLEHCPALSNQENTAEFTDSVSHYVSGSYELKLYFKILKANGNSGLVELDFIKDKNDNSFKFYDFEEITEYICE